MRQSKGMGEIMELSLQDFFHNFRQELMAGAEANQSFQLSEFVEEFANDLIETGFIEGFEFCHFRAQRGLRVDGYWFNDEGVLDLFIADFDCREDLLSLTKTDVELLFKRLNNFFEASREKTLYQDLEETSPEYGLARQIQDRGHNIRKINFFLISERELSGRLQELEDSKVCGIPASYHVWDISRLQRQRSSRGHKEVLEINFRDDLGATILCLPAHLGSATYESYLIVIPATILSSLYEKHGARLLEQNVRCFLQARGNVNKGIRNTLINEPQMFFAYNNGITATAQEVETEKTELGLELIRIKDLQIVNGGQTTASLFHTHSKDKVPLDSVFVQMKLSVVDEEKAEIIVPKISEFANTQNKVNAADFFSNHPFHVRIEEYSRRIWAPPQQGAQRETKWFYERARGQYLDAQSKLTVGDKKRFQAEHPKPQMFTKTDLAKFENVWDENPRFVNLGAQKNFVHYASRIGQEWEKSSDNFNEFYYKRIIARTLIFRKTEKLVSAQEWYSGGYRANVVAYTIGLLGYHASENSLAIDFKNVWDKQFVPEALERAIIITAKLVHDDLIVPPQGISNVTEWAKREGCWQRIQGKVKELDRLLPENYKDFLVSKDVAKERKRDGRSTQRIDNGIEAQRRVMEIPSSEWNRIVVFGIQKNIVGPKEAGILKIATHIPNRIPSEKQSIILIEIIEKVKKEGFSLNE
jgi:hypothetical protein